MLENAESDLVYLAKVVTHIFLENKSKNPSMENLYLLQGVNSNMLAAVC